MAMQVNGDYGNSGTDYAERIRESQRRNVSRIRIRLTEKSGN